MALDFPSLLTPRSQRWRLGAVTISGGVTVGGTAPLARTDGGGLWVCEQNIFVHGRDAMLQMQAFEAAMDGGVEPVLVKRHIGSFGPIPPGVHWPVTITVGAAAKRATALTLNVSQAAPLQAGVVFSIDHTGSAGRRKYVVRSADIAVAGSQAITVRPPLREAVAAGKLLDFIDPSCPMRLTNPDAFSSPMGLERTVELNPVWVEAF